MGAALSLALVTATGCDEVAKAVDANNQQPGEADARAVELTSSPNRLNALALDDGNIVIIAQNGDVSQRPRSNAPGAITKIGAFKRGEYTSRREAMALDADAIWLINDDALYRMPRAGGDGEKVAEASGESLAVASGAVFFASHDHKKIVKYDKATKTTTDYATGFTYTSGIALDEAGDKFYVSDRDAETISSLPTSGDAPVTPTVLAKDQAAPEYVGTGPSHVYWNNGALSDHKDITDRLMRIAKTGAGAPEQLASTKGGFSGPIHADDKYVYGGEAGGGLYRAAVTSGDAVKFLDIAVTDFIVTTDSVFAIENNGYRFSDEAKSKPNRILTVTK